jgi:hypothetical protein
MGTAYVNGTVFGVTHDPYDMCYDSPKFGDKS